MMDIGDALNSIKDTISLGAPMALAVLPLVAVLRSAPPMYDDDKPKKKTPRRRLLGGWRITITIARNEAHTP